jgi:hypothetical protein
MSGFENDVVFAKNADFTQADNQVVQESNGLFTNGQLWIGTTALNVGGTHINVGSITSPSGTLTVGYSSPNITLDLSGGSIAIDAVQVQTGTSPVAPTAGGLITFNGGVVAAGTNPVRSNGTGPTTYALEVQISQAIAAADATKIGLSNFDSAAFDVSATGFVQLNGGGIASTSFDVQANTGPGTDPVVPTAAGVVIVNGAAVANHSVVLETRSRAANTYNLEVQYAASAASTDATKSGVAHFDSAAFSVDANGFVSLAGGGLAIDSIGVDATSGGGTNPVLPTVGGLVTVNGAVVAAGTNPIRSVSTAANVYQIQAQTSQAVAAADATRIGLSNFDSASFAVAATGFVTLATTGALKTLSGDTGTATPVANNIQIAGGPGITTSAAGAVVTINSVVFTDTGAATLAVDNGYNATAAGNYPMPATALQGELIIVFCDTAGAVVLDCPANNFIRIGALITSSGGTATSTSIGDSLTLRYRLSTLTWEATSVIGTWVMA